MSKKTSSVPKSDPTDTRESGWSIGRAGFAKVSAVEGISLTPSMEARRSEMDRAGASAAERRAAIVKAHKR